MYSEWSFKRVLEPVAVFLLSSAGATYCSYLFLQDLRNLGAETAGTELAQLKNGLEGVRRKARSSLVWSPVSTGAPLFLRDSISVGPDSFAVIETKKNEQIEVGPNSLIQLNNTEDFTAGFMRGSFFVRTETGDTKIEIQQNGTKKIEKINARLISPSPQQVFYITKGETLPVTFNWNIRNTEKAATHDGLKVEVSRTRSFTKTETYEIKDLENGKQSQTFSDPGGVFWRIRDSSGPLSETRSFKIVKLEPLILNPVVGTSVSWNTPNAVPTELTVETTDEKANTKKEFSVSPFQRSLSLASLTEGSYQVRIIAHYGTREIASLPANFQVQKEIPYELEPVSPTPDSKLTPSKLVHFIWKTNKPSKAVKLEIERDGKSVFSKDITAQTFSWKDDSLGNFRWRLATGQWQAFARAKEEVKVPVPEPVAPPHPEDRSDSYSPSLPSIPPPEPAKKKERLQAPKELSVEIE